MMAELIEGGKRWGVMENKTGGGCSCDELFFLFLFSFLNGFIG